MAAGVRLPRAGKAVLSVKAADKAKSLEVARSLAQLGFALYATRGTAAYLQERGLKVTPVNKVTEGRPHIVDLIKNNEVAFIVNTVEEKRSAIADSRSIRTSALAARVTFYTTVEGARAACAGMQQLAELETYALQSLHASLQ
jgi:carbamoyl-phosphate synthase large subunit